MTVAELKAELDKYPDGAIVIVDYNEACRTEYFDLLDSVWCCEHGTVEIS